MLKAADDKVSAAAHYALYGQIQRMGAVEGEDYVFRRGSEGPGDELTGGVDRFRGPQSKPVAASAGVSAKH